MATVAVAVAVAAPAVAVAVAVAFTVAARAARASPRPLGEQPSRLLWASVRVRRPSGPAARNSAYTVVRRAMATRAVVSSPNRRQASYDTGVRETTILCSLLPCSPAAESPTGVTLRRCVCCSQMPVS